MLSGNLMNTPSSLGRMLIPVHSAAVPRPQSYLEARMLIAIFPMLTHTRRSGVQQKGKMLFA